MNFFKSKDFIIEPRKLKENTLVIVESENHKDFSEENNSKNFYSACSNKNLNFFHDAKLEWFKNSSEAENNIIEYFSRIIKKEILQGEDEFFFLELNDDIKIKIFERITEGN